MNSLLRRSAPALILATVFLPAQVQACATCFGASDEPMAKGMNMGIFSLLAVVVFVLGLLGAFFVFVARRSALTPMPKEPSNSNAMVNT
jgi:hypothetical protein